MQIDLTGMNKTAAKALIRKLDDPTILAAALATETRATVREAIEARLRALNASPASQAELPLDTATPAETPASPDPIEQASTADVPVTEAAPPTTDKGKRKGRTAGLQARTARLEEAEAPKAKAPRKPRSKRPRGAKAAPVARTKAVMAAKPKVTIGTKRQPRHSVDFPRPNPADPNAQAMCTNCHHVGPVATDFGWRTLKRTRKRDGAEIEIRAHQPRCKPCRGGKAAERRQAAGLE